MPGKTEDRDAETRLWRPVDASIWASAPPRPKLERMLGRFTGILSSLSVASLVVIGPMLPLVSILVLYPVTGPALLGPSILVLWALLLAGFVLVLERTGYARNFGNWDLPLKRFFAVPVAFLVLAGIYYLLYLLLAAK